MVAEVQYCVIFGKGDSSDWIDWEIELTPEEEIAYNNALKNEIPLDEVEELQSALNRAYEEIEEEEISNNSDDEFVMECLGETEMDCDELNEMVASRDPYALEFFGLEDASEEELSSWNAYDLDEVPMVRDFVEDFEPDSPYDLGWSLVVKFADPE